MRSNMLCTAVLAALCHCVICSGFSLTAGSLLLAQGQLPTVAHASAIVGCDGSPAARNRCPTARSFGECECGLPATLFPLPPMASLLANSPLVANSALALLLLRRAEAGCRDGGVGAEVRVWVYFGGVPSVVGSG